MKKSVITLDVDSSIRFTKMIVSKLKELEGIKLSQRKLNKYFRKYLDPMVHSSTLELETIKESGFFTSLFLKWGWITKKSLYYYWYHLFFPTIRSYEGNDEIYYIIDAENVFRYILTYNNGLKVIFRCNCTYDMILEKISYRIINNNKKDGDNE